MVRKPQLNYDPEYPIEQASPFSVEPMPDAEKMSRNPDYIPPDGIPLPWETRVCINGQVMPVSQAPSQPTCVPQKNAEYVSPEANKERERKRDEWVKSAAKKIYRESLDKVRTYDQAKKLVDAASEEDKASPNPTLLKAIKMVELGPPMTKKKALEMARERADGNTRMNSEAGFAEFD